MPNELTSKVVKDLVDKLSKKAIEITVKQFGKVPLDNTIEELTNPTGVDYNKYFAVLRSLGDQHGIEIKSFI